MDCLGILPHVLSRALCFHVRRDLGVLNFIKILSYLLVYKQYAFNEYYIYQQRQGELWRCLRSAQFLVNSCPFISVPDLKHTINFVHGEKPSFTSKSKQNENAFSRLKLRFRKFDMFILTCGCFLFT